MSNTLSWRREDGIFTSLSKKREILVIIPDFIFCYSSGALVNLNEKFFFLFSVGGAFLCLFGMFFRAQWPLQVHFNSLNSLWESEKNAKMCFYFLEKFEMANMDSIKHIELCHRWWMFCRILKSNFENIFQFSFYQIIGPVLLAEFVPLIQLKLSWKERGKKDCKIIFKDIVKTSRGK